MAGVRQTSCDGFQVASLIQSSGASLAKTPADLPCIPTSTNTSGEPSAAVIHARKNEVLAKTGIGNFKVMIFPSSDTARWIVPRLKARGIELLDYSGLKVEDYAVRINFGTDSHPTAEAHPVIGKLLVHDLAE